MTLGPLIARVSIPTVRSYTVELVLAGDTQAKAQAITRGEGGNAIQYNKHLPVAQLVAEAHAAHAAHATHATTH